MQFGSFVPVEVEELRAHVLKVESENSILKQSLIDAENEKFTQSAGIMEAAGRKQKELQDRIRVLETEHRNMDSTVAELREELRQKWSKIPKKEKPNKIVKELEDERALTESLCERLSSTESKLAESQSIVDQLRKETQKAYDIRNLLNQEMHLQYEAGVCGGFKAFSRAAYDFLLRFRDGAIIDAILKR
jgi:chromosome segregation ATPase